MVTIHDNLDTPAHSRDITIMYNAEGRIADVVGFDGREVMYAYYDGIELGGNEGDLKAVMTPAVTGTPHGNDFPGGKTTTYTYSTGSADVNLNHNLLTITDGKGQTYLENTYAPTQNPAATGYDHLVRQRWGDPGDNIDVVYVTQVPEAANGYATIKAIVNDPVGEVSEHFFDGGNRRVMTREYTGRADPDQPTTDANNRPTGKVRPTDPDYFEKRYKWNADSLLIETTDPNLNVTRRTYDSWNLNPRRRGDLLEACRAPGPLGGAQDQICQTFEHNTPHGGCGCGSNFVTSHVDGRGNATLHTYDANGNRTHTQHRIPSIVEDFEYNEFGQMTQRTLPDNGNGCRRIDVYTYYTEADGPQNGYLENVIRDAVVPESCPCNPPPLPCHFELTTTYEYDALGRVVRSIDARGHDKLYTYNQLGQIVRTTSREVTDGGGVRYQRDTFYDANDNVVRTDIQNKDEDGTLQPNTHFTTVYEYDILNALTRICQESGDYTGAIPGPPELPTCDGLPVEEFITHEYEYDDDRRLTRSRYGEAVAGNQPTNTVTMVYDERDLLFKAIRAQGDPDQSTTQYGYDANGNVTRRTQGIEDVLEPRVTLSTYDGHDRRVTSVDPMGNVARYEYDGNSNIIDGAEDGQLIDEPGGAGNVRLSEVMYVYDELDRLIRTEVEYFDTDTQAPIGDGMSTTEFQYTPTSRISRLLDDFGDGPTIDYDTAGRRLQVTDAKGNIVGYTYDDNSNVTSRTTTEKSDLGDPDEIFTTIYMPDNLGRTVDTVDAEGNVIMYGYNSRHNLVHVMDARGNETQYVYDGINRLTSATRDMDEDGPDGDGEDIVTTQQWDDTSRLISVTDANDNTTEYEYDPLDRIIKTYFADCTEDKQEYDVHDNAIMGIDANGTVVFSSYDQLDRPTSRTIDRASIAGGDSVDVLGTTFETYQYDGLSRLVSAEDDDSLITRSHNSLSLVTRETLNGQTTSMIYDSVGSLTECTYPGARSITRTYDDLHRPTVISDQSGTIATYDYVGYRVERTERGNNTRTDYTYDGATGTPNPPGDFGVKQIIRTRHTRIPGGETLDDRTYIWDPTGNKTQRKDIRGPLLTYDWDFDDANRLVQTTVSDGAPPLIVRETEYVLDGVGNREGVIGTPDAGPYEMNDTLCEPADRQVSQYTKTPMDCRTYDPKGNLTRVDPPETCACTPAQAPQADPDLIDQGNGTTNRYLSFVPTNPGVQTAIRVTFVDLPPPHDYANGRTAWVGQPFEVTEASCCNGPTPPPTFWAATLDCTPHFDDWTQYGIVDVYDAGINPASTYDIEAVSDDCNLADEAGYSEPLTVVTSIVGDVVRDCSTTPCTPPNGVVDFLDITVVVDKFRNLPTAVRKARADLINSDVSQPIPDRKVDFVDISLAVEAFRNTAQPPVGPPLADPCSAVSTAVAKVGQVVLPVPPGGSPATPQWQVNVPLTRNNDLSYSVAAGVPGVKELAYDYRNQMVEYNDLDSGQRHIYGYDVFGRRIEKVLDADGVAGGPDETRYFYAISKSQHDTLKARVIEEQNSVGATVATYVYGRHTYGQVKSYSEDSVLNMQSGSGTSVCVGGDNHGANCAENADCPDGVCESAPLSDYYYHADDLYSVMAVTDAAGNAVERYEYQDYGEPMIYNAQGEGEEIPESAIDNPHLFRAGRYEPEIELYYSRTGYLEPRSGRFTTRDTIGLTPAEWGDPVYVRGGDHPSKTFPGIADRTHPGSMTGLNMAGLPTSFGRGGSISIGKTVTVPISLGIQNAAVPLCLTVPISLDGWRTSFGREHAFKDIAADVGAFSGGNAFKDIALSVDYLLDARGTPRGGWWPCHPSQPAPSCLGQILEPPVTGCPAGLPGHPSPFLGDYVDIVGKILHQRICSAGWSGQPSGSFYDFGAHGPIPAGFLGTHLPHPGGAGWPTSLGPGDSISIGKTVTVPISDIDRRIQLDGIDFDVTSLR